MCIVQPSNRQAVVLAMSFFLLFVNKTKGKMNLRTRMHKAAFGDKKNAKKEQEKKFKNTKKNPECEQMKNSHTIELASRICWSPEQQKN